MQKANQELIKDNIKNQETNKNLQNDNDSLLKTMEEIKKINAEKTLENKKLLEILKDKENNDKNNIKDNKSPFGENKIGNEGAGINSLSRFGLSDIEKVEKYKNKINDYKIKFDAYKNEITLLKEEIRELRKLKEKDKEKEKSKENV